MHETTSSTPAGLWMTMNALVRDNSGGTYERVGARINMPFSRFRALRRLEAKSRTQRELASMMGVDAPAMTGIVTDLAERGLIVREVHPTDARSKIVTITEAGRQILNDVRTSPGIAPSMFDVLSTEQRHQLATLLDLLRQESE
ncbi:MarR family winged helix-turn-helix transcriptional regulator [Smaragdicoccus niigatensis]|uniref:MarR family winged helix-turn-helix transcriptional regulator n=1 Tax=Smaragdicoccus niigatensis TaxID=359359 RepID=UPI000475B14A|nr:MarR family transcriptional regulator [Smaragdicoccus niigatensis]